MRSALILLGFLVAAPSAVAESVRVEVDQNSVLVGEPFQFRVIANGARIAEPIIPHADGLRIERRPIHQSTRQTFSMRNGQVQQGATRTWVFEAEAIRAGEIALPSISVSINGQRYETDELALSARRGEAPQAAPSRPSLQPNRRNDGPTLDDVLLVETDTDKRTAYQGEQIMLSLRIYQLDLAGVSADFSGRTLPLPTTEGFYSGPVVEGSRKVRRNDLEYRLREWRQPLYPTSPGEYEIGAWTWKGRVSAYSQSGLPVRDFKTLVAPEIHVTVLPLPEQPPNFSGAVGSYRLTATLDRQSTRAGVPAILELAVIGEGNPDAIGAPQLPPLAWAQVSDPETVPAPTGSQFGGEQRKTFTYEIVPLDPGTHTIPQVELVYFAPGSATYETASAEPVALIVQESTESTDLVLVGGSTRASDGPSSPRSQLRPILALSGPLRPGGNPRWALALGGLVPPFAYAGVAAYALRQRHRMSNPEWVRQSRALTTAQERLDRCESNADPLSDLFRAMAEFVADKLAIGAAGLTSQDVDRFLQENGAADESRQAFVRVMRACERQRYAASAASQNEVQALVAAARQAIERIDGSLTKAAT